jgi:hypothetical protein
MTLSSYTVAATAMAGISSTGTIRASDNEGRVKDTSLTFARRLGLGRPDLVRHRSFRRAINVTDPADGLDAGAILYLTSPPASGDKGALSLAEPRLAARPSAVHEPIADPAARSHEYRVPEARVRSRSRHRRGSATAVHRASQVGRHRSPATNLLGSQGSFFVTDTR